jgi:hypothetical protein
MGFTPLALSWVYLKGMPLNKAASAVLMPPIHRGFVADTVLYLSYYFDTNALSVRLSWFWVSMTMTSILGSFLGAGLLALRGKGGLEGWRWLFMVEGIITFLISVWAYFYLPAGPTQTAGGIRGKGWFTEYVGCIDYSL